MAQGALCRSERSGAVFDKRSKQAPDVLQGGESPKKSAPSPRHERRLSVWLLTNAPSPYQLELLSAVGRDTSVEIDVRFMRGESAAAPGGGRPWAFRSRVMAGLAPRRLRDELRLHPRAVWEAATGSHDCHVLSGLYTSATFLLCAAVLTARGKRWILWMERPRLGAYRMRWARGQWLRRAGLRLRNGLLRRLLRASHGTICMGTAAVEAYEKLGAERRKLYVLPYCCDVSRFRNPDPEAVGALRKEWRLEGKTVFLFSGQMIERKGVDVALRAFERIGAMRADVAFLLLGDGPLRAQLEASVAEDVRDRVHFAGFIEQARLPIFFGAADVFVFPSRHDGWGVVINEACGAGMPVIASKQTGAARDLVAENDNGFLVDAEDVAGFAERMREMADAPERRRALGAAAQRAVEQLSVEQGALRFQRILAEDSGGHIKGSR
jgi:glycosyltransferase involved in cell wall biosynthesis